MDNIDQLEHLLKTDIELAKELLKGLECEFIFLNEKYKKEIEFLNNVTKHKIKDVIDLFKNEELVFSKTFEDLPKLNLYSTHIVYSNLKAIKIPLNLFEFGCLKTLTLLHNRIKDIPKEICNLKNLKYLNISNNKISVLPQELNQLGQLIDLFIESNLLKEFPNIFDLYNLNSLFLDGNQISYIPKEINKLVNLDCLSITDNNLTELPDELFELSKLQHLNLGFNKIEKISDKIVNLRNLKTLNLVNNPVVRDVNHLQKLLPNTLIFTDDM